MNSVRFYLILHGHKYKIDSSFPELLDIYEVLSSLNLFYNLPLHTIGCQGRGYPEVRVDNVDNAENQSQANKYLT
jgi:hypothetical protein